MNAFLNIIWSAFDAVFDWCTLAFSTYDLNFSSVILGMLCVTLLIGYILSPYLHNPLPSASQIRDRRQALIRSEMRANDSRARYEATAARTEAYRNKILSSRRPR